MTKCNTPIHMHSTYCKDCKRASLVKHKDNKCYSLKPTKFNGWTCEMRVEK